MSVLTYPGQHALMSLLPPLLSSSLASAIVAPVKPAFDTEYAALGHPSAFSFLAATADLNASMSDVISGTVFAEWNDSRKLEVYWFREPATLETLTRRPLGFIRGRKSCEASKVP